MADEQLDPTAAAWPGDPAPAAEVPVAAQEPAPGVPPAVLVTSDPQPVPAVTGPENAPVADVPVPVPGPAPVAAAPVTVDNKTCRDDNDAQLGSWVDVIAGAHAARFGSYVDTVAYDPTTGYPSIILVRTRDARNELLEVNYGDVRPSERTGGR